MKMRGKVAAPIVLAFGAILTTALLTSPSTYAQAAGDATFSLQLTPSPLVDTVKPGVAKTVPIEIRNNGTSPEALKIELRHFNFNSETGGVDIDDSPATDIASWVTFASPKFTVAPGQAFTQNVKLNFPTNSGFSYSFVVIISRQSQPQASSGGRLLQGSVADFTLINVDRPGATKAVDITSIKTSAGIYEYVPATFSVILKNKGNTIVQPLGNIFVGRGDANNPIATLPFNSNQSYILPNTSRTITANWNDGFPRIETETASDGTTKSHTVWNWGDISKFRIGQYAARVVAVYNNGTYDVPLNAEVKFWIIPWKILLVAFIIVLIFAFGIFMIIRNTIKSTRSRRSGGFRL